VLDLEPLLIDRLKTLPGILGVYGAAEMMVANQAAFPSPCLYVMFDGYKPVEGTHSNKTTRIEARWLVVLSVRQVQQAAAGTAARSEAAPLFDAVLSALMGWVPPGYTPLALASAPGPEFSAGQLLFATAFTTSRVVKAKDF
jgi:hypothetical protein